MTTGENPLNDELSRLRTLLEQRDFTALVAATDALVASAATAPEPMFLRGVAQAELGQLAGAALSLRRAISSTATAPWTWQLVLLNVLRDQGSAADARAIGEHLLAHVGPRPQVLNAHGLTLQSMGDARGADDCFARAIAQAPAYVPARINAAASLAVRQETPAAVSLLRDGLLSAPQSVDLRLSLGNLLERAGDASGAAALYAEAVHGSQRPAPSLLRRYARVCQAQMDIFTAIEAYEALLAQEPDDADVLVWLGNAYLDVGLVHQATETFRRALDLRPEWPEVYDNVLLCLHYDPHVSLEEIYAAHLEWNARFGATSRLPGPAPRAAAEQIRVGFISRALYDSAGRAFFAPVLAHLDRKRFWIACYSTGRLAPPQAQSLLGACNHVRDVSALDDPALCDAIAADRLDVLVDLDGHVPGNRLRALTRKPARTQVTWLDYFDTTGSAAFDALIGDPVSTPDTTPQRFAERVVRLDPCRLCYEAPAYAPPVTAPPVLRNGFVTFGSFNRLSKLSDTVLDHWCSLLMAIPDAHLVLKNGAFAHPRTRERFAQRFVARGIARERLSLRGPSPHEQMLREYGDVDIALDPTPYNGGLTTCEALWMGLPVVAILGESMISRQSAALLTAANRPELVAADWNGWLDANLALASAPERLAETRSEARARLGESALLDHAAFTRRLEALLEDCVAKSE